MTLKQGTLFGIIGAAIKVLILLVRIVSDYYYFSSITEVLDIFAYVAFGIFFITLYKKQK